MKKWYLVFFSLSFFTVLLPMENKLVTIDGEGDVLIDMDALGKRQKKNNKNLAVKNGSLVSRNDWPFLPLNNIKPWLQQISEKSYKRVCVYDSSVLMPVVGALPQDIIKLIVCKMLDNDEKSTEKFMNLPVIHAFSQYHQAKSELAQYSKLKNKSVGMWFRMSDKEKESFLPFKKQSISGSLFLGGQVALSSEELEEIRALDDEIQDKFVAGQEVFEIDDDADTECGIQNFHKKMYLVLGGVFIGYNVVVVIIGRSMGIPIPVIAGVAGGIDVLVCGISGVKECRGMMHKYQEAQPVTL